MSDLSEVYVGVCPDCGSLISVDDLNHDIQKLTLAAGMLVGASTTIDLLMHDPQYAAIAEGWHEYLRSVTDTVANMVHNTQSFGEAFDGSQSES